jgi:NADH-quinone oxidoreductase subunit J
VLFLFVIMLLGAERVGTGARLPLQGPIAVSLGFLLLVLLGYGLVVRSPAAPSGAPAEAAFGSPQAVGGLLFAEYLVPFEVASLLLLVAMVGAIVLTKEERKPRP